MFHLFWIKMFMKAQSELRKLIIKIPIQAIINPIRRAYARNDFYIRDLIGVSEPFRSVLNIFAGEMYRLYLAVDNASAHVMYTTISTIEAVPRIFERFSAVLRGTNDVMVGEIINVLLNTETRLYNAVHNFNSFLNQYAGRLEEIVMRKFEEFSQQATHLVNSYLHRLSPYLQRLDTYTLGLRQQLLVSLQGL